MKNIHVLPTDKPSRLYSKDGRHILDTTMAIDWYISSAGYKPQNIYITSNEEIKEECWVLNQRNGAVVKGLPSSDEWKKIILTTDQDLIKDGIQSIDYDFLEWFVKNPSCEGVEVKEFWFSLDKSTNGNLGITSNGYWGYKIKIPKEEQKQHLINMMKADEELGLYEEPKKETLDEVARVSFELGYDKGAKWQKERSYSEEEVINIIYKIYDEMGISISLEDVLEQFKKK